MKDGHLSKSMSPQDIANKHKVDIDAIKRQLKMGIKVEKEHTSNLKAATRIALDHLYEDPKYYSKLSKIRLEEIKYTEPNFDIEWEEAMRYPEFKDMGKQEWIKWASQGYTTKYSKIKNVLSNVDLNFKDLEEPKKQRFQTAFQNGTIEIPIAVKFDDTDYDLVAGNTRLSGLVKNNIDPEIWIVDLTKPLNENQTSSSPLNKALVSEFMKACMNELELDKLPKITFSNNSKEAIDMRSWGGYQPHKKSIYIIIAKRHPADIFRTLAHELVHYKQDLDGRLKQDSGNTGSEEENEANSKAAVIMRNFAQAKPNLFEHLITEIGEDLSSAYPFQYVGGENSKYTFKTDNFDYDVLFTLEDGDYDLAYDSPSDDGNYELIYKIKGKNIGELPLTGEGKAIKVNATVTAILLDFIKKNPNFISIMISPINQQRYNLLKKFIDNNLPSNYDVKGNGTLMLITHKK
jgi:hypothetical protein